MKFFFSVVLVSVLLCTVVVSAAPSLMNDESILFGESSSGTDKSVKLRQLLKCVDRIFDELVGDYKELEKYRSQYKTYAKEIHRKLDECDKTNTPDSKRGCVLDAIYRFMLSMMDLWTKLREGNKELAPIVSDAVQQKCLNKKGVNFF